MTQLITGLSLIVVIFALAYMWWRYWIRYQNEDTTEETYNTVTAATWSLIVVLLACLIILINGVIA